MTELRQVGLDIKAGNFLIPQGCIEHFALKMPKALTIMFEQTCNSIAYKADYERYIFDISDIIFALQNFINLLDFDVTID